MTNGLRFKSFSSDMNENETIKSFTQVDVKEHVSNIIPPRDFEYILGTRKNGKKFIKVVMYFNDAEGYVEIARINPIKNHFNEDGYGDITHLFDELEKRDKIIEDLRNQLIQKRC